MHRPDNTPQYVATGPEVRWFLKADDAASDCNRREIVHQRRLTIKDAKVSPQFNGGTEKRKEIWHVFSKDQFRRCQGSGGITSARTRQVSTTLNRSLQRNQPAGYRRPG